MRKRFKSRGFRRKKGGYRKTKRLRSYGASRGGVRL